MPAQIAAAVWSRWQPSSQSADVALPDDQGAIDGTGSDKGELNLSQKVLITGADGFIGSHLTESLVEAGYDVWAITTVCPISMRLWDVRKWKALSMCWRTSAKMTCFLVLR